MTRWQDWPALEAWAVRGPGAPAAARIEYERGVYGKVPGADSDFRWIALSEGLDRATLPERQLKLGSENRPRRAPFWFSGADGFWAGTVYPSKATDSAGRSGFLEKQAARWQRPAALPAALGALVLLPFVATWDEQIWLQSYDGKPWYDDRFHLYLEPTDLEPATIDDGEIARTIDGGCAEIVQQVGLDRLAEIYAGLLAGRQVVLTAMERPLGPQALAALLLPLPAERVATLSLLGWVPASRVEADDLETWHLAVTAAALDRPAVETSPQARAMARAIQERSPDGLRAVGSPRRSLPSQSRWTSAGTAPSGREEPPSVARASGLDDVNMIPDDLEEAAVWAPTPQPVRDPTPVPRTTSTFPDRPTAELAELPAHLRELLEFGLSPRRRWLRPESFTIRPARQLSVEDAETLWRLPDNVAAQRPERAAPDQWDVKVALLRSAILALTGGRGLADPSRLLTEPGADRAPGLLVAASQDLPIQLDPALVSQLLEQARRCPHHGRKKRIEQWGKKHGRKR